MHSRNTLIKFSAVVLALSATPKLLSETFTTLPVSAQTFSPSPFPLPASLPDGTTIKVDGSTSMQVANEEVQQRLQEKFSGSTVELAENGSNEALEALLNGDIEVAAIGRFLTDAEKAKGLKEARISREKIAIIIGADNPYQGDVTFDQFAKIFRGEITDWSEIGGPPGPIRFIDRPDYSDTRIAFQNYPVFQSAPFETGANTTQVADDETETVIQALGNDGISYAIADQVTGNNSIKIVPMHQTLPDDIRYPFSQPRLYVYRDAAAPAALAFLGFATTAPGQEIAPAAVAAPSPSPAIASPEVSPEASLEASPEASPEAAIAPSPDTTTAQAPVAVEPERGGGFPLWLLAIPLLGGLLWWLTRGRGTTPAAVPPAPIAAPPAPVVVPPPVAPIPAARMILTPRDCRNAYAYWEVSEERKAQFREQGGQRMAVRLYDVTDINMDNQMPHSVKQFDCRDAEPDLHIPIGTDDRDYVAELGYLTEDGRWLKVARSEHVRVPVCPPPPVEPKPVDMAVAPSVAAPSVRESLAEPTVEPPKVGNSALATGAVLAGGAAIAGAALANAAAPKAPEPPAPVMPPVPVKPQSRLILTPKDAQQHAYAYWEAPEAEKEALKRTGGQDFLLRLHDVTGRDTAQPLPPAIEQFKCAESDQDRHVKVPHYDRDYLAEIGYLTPEGRWLQLARSNSIRLIATAPEEAAKVIAPMAGVAAAAIPTLTRTVESEQRPAEMARQQLVTHSAPTTPCSIQNITVHSRRNCFLLDEAQMRQLQEQTAVTQNLQLGTHLVRIKSGAFGYGIGAEHHEPIVLLWISGGRVINKQTNVPVAATWVTLNGYDETLTLEVVEPTTLHAFFFDTHIQDNEDEVTLSVVSLPNF